MMSSCEGNAEDKKNSTDPSDATTDKASSNPTQVPTFIDSAVAGFLDNFKLELTHVSQEIRTLTEEQNKVLEKVGEHNGIIQSNPDMAQLIAVMDEMKGGMERLSKLRHDMTTVHDRSEKLRSRAEKLESFCKNAQKREDDLVAKMDMKPSPSDQS